MAPTRNRPHRVVVTGASAGVGRAVAVAFAEAGYHVALLARGQDRLESARRECESKGVRALAIRTDVANADEVFEASDRVAREWGGIDVWVNAAMVTIMAPVSKITPDEIRRVTEVTYLGQVHGTMAALSHMLPRDAGTILQVGSALAYRSIPLQSAYCAAKAAVRGFTDSLRCELIHEKSNIDVTMVQLPGVNTPQFDWARNRMSKKIQPVPPIYQPEAIAHAIVAASRGGHREYWLGWSAIRTIAANFIAPGWLDHFAAKVAWRKQLTAERAEPNRDDNLFSPPPGDPGAHGRFDSRASYELHYASAGTVRAAALTLGLAALAGVGWGAAALARRGDVPRYRLRH